MEYLIKYSKSMFSIIILLFVFLGNIHILAKVVSADNVMYEVSEIETEGTEDRYASLINGKDASENFEIPKHILSDGVYYEVNTIAEEAFINSNVSCIIIPDTVTSIGIRAFSDCKNLTTVDLNSKVLNINDYAFYGSGLTALKIPSGEYYMGDSAFSGCMELKTVSMEQGIESIGSNAFGWCINLESVNFSSGIKEIGERAFYHCAKLGSVELPDSVLSIGNGAFSWCKNLENVKLSNGITEIRSQTFSRCSKLESIVIPESVESIDSYAFDACGSLVHVEVPQGIKYLGEMPFGNSSEEELTQLREVVCVKDSFIDNKDHFYQWNQYGVTYPEFSYKISDAPMSGSIFGEYTFMAYIFVGILLIVLACGVVAVFYKRRKYNK